MTTQIEIVAPACLALAAARIDGRPALLGVALRHPPVHLTARPWEQLSVSGARADLAFRQAADVLDALALSGAGGEGDLEIELAIPSLMGLASSPILGLSVARGLALLHARPADDVAALAHAAGLGPGEGLAMQAFSGGGLLLADAAGAARRRLALDRRDETRDWVFVLALPRPPAGTPATTEQERLAALWRAAAALDGRAEELVAGRLWPAAEADDIAAFAAALAELQSLVAPPALSAEEQALLAIMRAGGALACGRAPTGLGIYGLVRGAAASQGLCRDLAARMGHMGGSVLASTCDPAGARTISRGPPQ